MRYTHRCPACGTTLGRQGHVLPAFCFFKSEKLRREADRQVGVKQHASFFNTKKEMVLHEHLASTGMQPRPETSAILEKPSPLLALPVELLQNILGRLSDIDVFSMRLSCKRLYTLTNRKPPALLEGSTVSSLREMLLRESFRRGCDFEKDGTLSSSIATCNRCQHSHKKEAFTAGELARPPETRACYCKTGVIQLCIHKTCSFTELQSLTSSSTSKYGYQSSKSKFRSFSLDCCSDLPDAVSLYFLEREHRITWSLGMFKKLMEEAALRDLLDLLARSCGRFCPHIQPQSIWQLLTAANSLSHETLVVKDIREIQCASKDCHTQVSWSRWRHGPIQLNISRRFSIERPDDLSYLAQLIVSKEDQVDNSL